MAPSDIIVFGGTGDLMKRKLIHAFLHLQKSGVLEEASSIIGVGRRPLDDSSYREFLAKDLDKEIQEGMKSLPIKYYRHDLDEDKGLEGLKKVLKEDSSRIRIFYLATTHEFFPQITEEIAKAKLNEPKTTRIVFEKPFGNNLKSSDELNASIKKAFTEEQTFRIDHYLAKEGVKKIVSWKSKNKVFEKSLSNSSIESIEIVADETIGVGERIEYYDASGAIKDMIQSHLLQLLSLVIMDTPASPDSEALHSAKVQALKSLRPDSPGKQLLGQYSGYASEVQKHGIKNSKTETFARIVLKSQNSRWKDVPLILRAGKKLGIKKGEFQIVFKEGKSSGIEGVKDNMLTIELSPSEKGKSGTEYASLIRDVIRGDQALFPSFDEVRICWEIIENLEKMRKEIPFIVYPEGTHSDKLDERIK